MHKNKNISVLTEGNMFLFDNDEEVSEQTIETYIKENI